MYSRGDILKITKIAIPPTTHTTVNNIYIFFFFQTLINAKVFKKAREQLFNHAATDAATLYKGSR